MIETFKDYLTPKRFGIVAYVCVITHFLCGLVFTAVTGALRASETEKFSCIVDANRPATYKTQVDKACFSRYKQVYNTPLPLYGFVLLSIGSTTIVSVIYSLAVSKRVDEIEARNERGSNADAVNRRQHDENRRTVYVLYLYFIHLAIRLACGFIFILLQYTFFYPNGFDLKFSCVLPTKEVTPDMNSQKNASRLNSTTVECENPTSSEKTLFGAIVFVINIIFTVVILGEVIFLSRRLPVLNFCSEFTWSCDTEFVNCYFLRQQYRNGPPLLPNELQPTNIGSTFEESVDSYKLHVLNLDRSPDINYIPKTTLEKLHVDVVIHTGRAQHMFSKDMQRHEIYDVYLNIPSSSFRLEKYVDLFNPNEEHDIVPRKILMIGRPGIGKTVLTEKIFRDWANGTDEYYSDKIAFIFKFRWFNRHELTNLSLKSFLQIGSASVSTETFDGIYELVTKKPQNVILIFDGLDEFNGNLADFLDQSRLLTNDLSTCMHGMNLFLKILMGLFLEGATVLVTSRPTTDDFCSKFSFRNVEIIGFTPEKVEEYVSRFCNNNDRSDLIPKIWGHINSSSELLNLCYIPENSFIVCVALSGCLSDKENVTSVLPTTLTELYQTAIDHFEKHHGRKVSSGKMLGKLQQISFCGMLEGQLIFDDDEFFDEETKMSGLLNHLSKPRPFPIHTQFCFIHLTIQEFLAAKYVIETFSPDEIKTFISEHVTQSKWHLVLQFLAGLLGKKMKKSDRKEYKDCILAFCEVFKHDQYEIYLTYNNVCAMKCLKETDDEDNVKLVCETTAIKDAVRLRTGSEYRVVFPNDLAAVSYFCKHLKHLTCFELRGLNTNSQCLREISGLLTRRCISELTLIGSPFGKMDVEVDRLFMALMNSECSMNHEHVKLTRLALMGFLMSERVLSQLFLFFDCGYARELVNLGYANVYIPSRRISKFLARRFSWSFAFSIKNHCKLTELHLNRCSVTFQDISILCESLLEEEDSKLNILDVGGNPFIGDEGGCMLFDAIMKEHCKLTSLIITGCSLTHRCIPKLCRALRDKHCKLTELYLSGNNLGDKSACQIFEDVLAKEHCKLTKLCLDNCNLTDQCIPRICKILKNGRCGLKELSLYWNDFTSDEGVLILLDARKHGACNTIEFQIGNLL